MKSIRNFGIGALAALLMGAAFAPAHAATLTIADATGNPNAAQLPAGGTFIVSLLLDTSVSGEQAVGVGYFLETLDNGSGQFQIVSRNVSASPFSALTTDNATALAPANALLDPRNENDLGGLTPDAAPVAPGNYTVARLAIQVMAGTPLGTYTLQTAPGVILTDQDFNDIDLPQSAYTVIVAAAPEPATLSLLTLAPIALLARRRRHP